mmetsp:Transcript_88283/g.222237  ORF Transcript_88283/g.222237 Transcript_88283/m.222237 type:complete len:350 (+) Transcript_88283:66-1115(+)
MAAGFALLLDLQLGADVISGSGSGLARSILVSGGSSSSSGSLGRLLGHAGLRTPKLPAVSAASLRGGHVAAAGTAAPPSAEFLAGLAAGVAVDVPLHPLDTLKTRLQAPEGFAASGGMRGLWGGLSPVLLRALPCSAIFFSTYGLLQRSASQHLPALRGTPWCDAAAGAGANLSACFVRVPCEVVKQHMQAKGPHGPDTALAATARRVAGGGIRSLYAGFGATVGRELVFAALQMPLFEELMRRQPLSGDPQGHSDRVLCSTVCGGVSGAVAGAATTPLDVAKTRMMLDTERWEGRGMRHAMADLYAEGGAKTLMRGAVPRTAYVGLSCALCFGAFEWSKTLLSQVLLC